jgi:hypothetical protein
MKTVSILITLILLSISGNKLLAQKSSSDCKFEVDQTDAKGKPVKKIKTKLNGTDVFYLIISRNDTTYQLTLNFWIAGAVRTVITKGETVTIKLSGGVDLKLATTGPVKPVAHYSDQTWSEYSPEYPIRAADVAKLKTNAPINLKLDVGDEKVFWEFTTKDLEKIRDMIRCIMK